MVHRERDVLEKAVRVVPEQAGKADDLVERRSKSGTAGPIRSSPTKMLRLELLNVKADLERELEGLRPQLFEVRPRRSLGLGARDHARPLGAPRVGAARGTGGPTDADYWEQQ